MDTSGHNVRSPLRPLAPLWRRERGNHVTAEAVYRTLREGIITGLLPAKTRLGEVPVATALSISRTPVREALHRLETERILERSARRGLVVAEVSADDILEVYAVRAAITGLAAQLAAASASQTDVIRLRRLNDDIERAQRGGKVKTAAELNLEFHELLCQASRNRLLLLLMQQVHDTVRRFPGTTLAVRNRAAAALGEHRAMVEAIAAHDTAKAEAIGRAHIERAMEVRIAMLSGVPVQAIRSVGQ